MHGGGVGYYYIYPVLTAVGPLFLLLKNIVLIAAGGACMVVVLVITIYIQF